MAQFIRPYEVILSFEFEGEIGKGDLSNESYRAVLSRGAVYYAVQGSSIAFYLGETRKLWDFCEVKSNLFWAPSARAYPSSSGAPGIPLPRRGTRTAFLSSVRQTHWSIIQLSLSLSLADLSAMKPGLKITQTLSTIKNRK